MPLRKNVFISWLLGLGVVIALLLSTAWFQIQSVRLGYKSQAVRRQIDELDKREEAVDRRLQETLSLARLDRLAKTRFNLQVPKPSQIVLLSDQS